MGEFTEISKIVKKGGMLKKGLKKEDEVYNMVLIHIYPLRVSNILTHICIKISLDKLSGLYYRI